MKYLIDTNVISELRKGNRADSRVTSWYSGLDDDAVFLSVLTLGEIQRGIERIGRRDPEASSALGEWLARVIMGFQDRIIPVDATIVREWGRLGSPDPLPVVDGLLAATARITGMTLATRNTKDVERTGVDLINPFA